MMLGRGIDQILPYPSDPTLHEPVVKDAREYVALAETANGPIPRPVGFDYVWGDSLGELDRLRPDVRIINLETSVTTSDDHWRAKDIHYRMNPRNVTCITEAKIDCCVLANNHILDWGYGGLAETLQTLKEAHVESAGAGMNLREAENPAVLDVPKKGRVLVFSFGSPTSGVSWRWAATDSSPSVNILRDFSIQTSQHVEEMVIRTKRAGDVAIASIHWGSNWGYGVPDEHVEFAHRLIEDAGIDIVHGHSSHHAKAIEIHRGKAIFYGCGDLLNDYEGISGHEAFRGDLALMYFLTVDSLTGELATMLTVPMQIRRFRLNRTTRTDAEWLESTLSREGKRFGTVIELQSDGVLAVCR
jgi:poly-gamma-glutamate synthesis protein (capsule biosynthesis protein)